MKKNWCKVILGVKREGLYCILVQRHSLSLATYLGSAALLERFINRFRTHHEKELVGGYSGSQQGGSILHFSTKAFTDVAYVRTRDPPSEGLCLVTPPEGPRFFAVPPASTCP